VKYPNPYRPRYETIASLSHDSVFVILATVDPFSSTEKGYPLEEQSVLGTTEPRTLLGITTQEFDAAHLTVGGEYIFFYGTDPVDSAACIVGGVRGVFAYDPTTQIVTRIDDAKRSRIPKTQSLLRFRATLMAAETIEASQPLANAPPICRKSATGIPSS
jgi:hypothetical protein